LNHDVEIFALVLAGGSGTRFWPKSRHKNPKQLSKLGSATETMLEITLKRLDGVVPVSNRFIVTHREQVEETKKVSQGLCATVIAEPDARNTANAICLAALEIQKVAKSKNPILISLHADAMIQRKDEFRKCLAQAVETSKSGYLTLLGIVPEYPETGFGYIELGDELSKDAKKVKSFKEKPDLETAKKYFESKKFLWNSGMFVFPLSLLLQEFQTYLPKNYASLKDATSNNLSQVYNQLDKISIDQGILERSRSVAVVPCDISWKDVGSWDVLGDVFGKDENGNFSSGNVLLIDSKNSVVESDGPLVATLGIRDLVVVHYKGAILVCPKSRCQDVKLIVEKLKKQNRFDLI